MPESTPIGLTEGRREFTCMILDNEPALDVAAAHADNVEAAQELQAGYPELGAWCSNALT